MAQALYPSAKESLLDQNPSIHFITDNLRVIFVTSAYTFDAGHDFFDDIQPFAHGDGGTARADGHLLTTPSATLGVFDADDAAFASVTGVNLNAFVLYKDDGLGDATSPLIAYFDSIPTVSPTAQALTILFDNGVNKIFKL